MIFENQTQSYIPKTLSWQPGTNNSQIKTRVPGSGRFIIDPASPPQGGTFGSPLMRTVPLEILKAGKSQNLPLLTLAVWDQ